MNREILKRLCLAFMIIAFVLCLANVVEACPTCKDGLTNSHDQAKLIQGYFWSIVFMMSMPFLILFGLGGYFYYLVRTAQAQQAAQRSVAAMPTTLAHPAK